MKWIFLLAIFPTSALASDKAIDWLLSFGFHISTPMNEELRQDTGFDLSAGTERVYLWGSLNNPSLRILGQGVGQLELRTFGLGTRFSIRENAKFVMEGGWVIANLELKQEVIRDEVVRQTLTNDFGAPPFRPDSYTYEVSDGYVIRAGIEYQPFKHFVVRLGARFGRITEELNMWDERIGRHNPKAGEADCLCWWREKTTIDITNVTIGLRYEF